MATLAGRLAYPLMLKISAKEKLLNSGGVPGKFQRKDAEISRATDGRSFLVECR